MTRERLVLAVVSVGLVLGAACQKAAPTRVAAAGVVAEAMDGAVAEQRLALLPVQDARPVDVLIRGLQERARRQPTKLDTWITLGQAWVRKAREAAEPGYYKNAEACSAIALRLDPQSLLGLNLHALVLLNDHRFAEAQRVAEGILLRSDFNPMALGTLSDALLEQGRIDAAEEAAQRMVSLKPGLPSYARASYLYFLRGNITAAKQVIRLAVDAAPSSRADPEPRAWALVQAANLFFLEGDYGGADAGYALALAGFPDYPPAQVGRAQVALAQERYPDAAELLDAAYQRSPLTETAWQLGDARRKAGDASGAAAAYALVLQSGRRTDPRTVALFLATRDRDLDEALALITAERRTRGDVYTQDVHAFVLLKKGRTAEARAAIDAVLAVGIKDPRILYHAALIHARSADLAGARALVEDTLRRSPRFDVDGAEAAQALRVELSASEPPSAPLASR